MLYIEYYFEIDAFLYIEVGFFWKSFLLTIVAYPVELLDSISQEHLVIEVALSRLIIAAWNYPEMHGRIIYISLSIVI